MSYRLFLINMLLACILFSCTPMIVKSKEQAHKQLPTRRAEEKERRDAQAAGEAKTGQTQRYEAVTLELT
jgi:hypothetical protein